ncbi:MAG: hypothetical protein MRY83_24935, partial [Flavobacteriales bacterium]|nr:hypothetical protein [Flavobacteriales bacterium]
MRLRLYLLVLILSSSFLSLLGQSNLLQVTHSVSPDVTICGPNEVFTVDLYNPSPFIMTNTQLEIILPPGLNYVPGSIQNASESNISVLNHPYFNVPDIDTLTYATITFEVNANCDLLNYASSGQILLSLARLDYVANNNNHFDDDQSPSFNALKPNLSIVGVSNQVYSGEIGDVYTRCITITNGGLGSLSEFTFLDEHGSGIQINNVSNGNWSNVDSTETIILTGQDFLSIGDGDTLFENGETIDICETVEILNCISVNSEFTASWGCDAASCQFSTSSANIVFPNLTPDISITSQSDMGVCIGTSSPNLQQLTITNNGLGTAKNVLLEIFQAYGQNNFQNSQRSFIDETSFTMTLNGAPITISIDSTRSNSPNNSCPGTNIGMVYVSLPDILFQDTLIIEWNTYSCCVSGCTGTIYSNGWWYRGTYSNICNSSFVIPQARGRSYSA